MNNSTHDARIEAALADLESQEKPNYSATAKKWQLERTTLAKRHKGQTVSKAYANSESRQRLTNEQEEVLIVHVNKLTNRGIPPTSQMVKNLAEEIAGCPVGKNWTGNFVKRHSNRLKSHYLRAIDNSRKKAEYVPRFRDFYERVESNCFFYCPFCLLLWTQLTDWSVA